MAISLTTWTRDRGARGSLNRFLGRVGKVEVGVVEFDGSNRLWTWSSPLDIEVWGHADSEEGAKLAFEAWLRAWVENFRPYFHPAGSSGGDGG